MALGQIKIHIQPVGGERHEWRVPDREPVELSAPEVLDRMRQAFDLHGNRVEFHWLDLLGYPTSDHCRDTCKPSWSCNNCGRSGLGFGIARDHGVGVCDRELVCVTAPDGRELPSQEADEFIRELQRGVFYLPQNR